MLSNSTDGTFRVWSLSREKHNPAEIVLTPRADELVSLTISSDSQWLAACDLSGATHLWQRDASGRFSDARTVSSPSDGSCTTAVAFSTSTTELLEASKTGDIRVWDLQQNPPALSRALSSTGSADSNTRSGAVRVDHPATDQYPIQDISVARNGEWIAAACGDGAIRLWSREDTDLPTHTLAGHTRAANTIGLESRWTMPCERRCRLERAALALRGRQSCR